MQRRCNYNKDMVANAQYLLKFEVQRREAGGKVEPLETGTVFRYYMDQLTRSTMVDVVILPHLDLSNVKQMSLKHIGKLMSIIEQMQQHEPFEMLTVHDAFHALPQNCNWVRRHYKEILADLADSELMTDLLNQLYGGNGKFEKLSKGLGDIVRKSNYALG